MSSPYLTAALRLLDDARRQGFGFHRIAPGDDGPLGVREGLTYRDVLLIGGFSSDGQAVRYGTSSLVVPGSHQVIKAVEGDALTVLHVVVTEWIPDIQEGGDNHT